MKKIKQGEVTECGRGSGHYSVFTEGTLTHFSLGRILGDELSPCHLTLRQLGVYIPPSQSQGIQPKTVGLRQVGDPGLGDQESFPRQDGATGSLNPECVFPTGVLKLRVRRTGVRVRQPQWRWWPV